MEVDRYTIKEADMDGKGVSVQPNPMELPVDQAKAVFDELTKDVIVPKFNAFVEEFAEVDLTSDKDKPISDAVQSALNLKVDKAFRTGSDVLYKVLSDNNYDDTEKENVASNTANRHNHSNKSTLDKVTESHLTQIASNTSARHTHSNKNTLDKVTESHLTQIANNTSARHTHSNKNTLDKITETHLSQIASNTAERHSHTNQTTLDKVTEYHLQQISDNTSQRHSHSNKNTLDKLTESHLMQIASSSTDRHTHENKNILDKVTESHLTQIAENTVNRHNHENKAQLDNINEMFFENILYKDNTEPFEPSGKYQPATVDYVDKKSFASGGGDMYKAVYDPNNKATDIFAYTDEKLKDKDAQLIITTKVGTTVTATYGSYRVEGTATSNTLILKLPVYGRWTLSVNIDGKIISSSVLVDAIKQYDLNFMVDSFVTVKMIADKGAVVTVTDGVIVMQDIGPEFTFYLPQEGNKIWTFTTTLGDATRTKSWNISENCTIDMRMLMELVLDTLPSKQSYLVGESFSKTGLSILAKWRDGTTTDVTANCSYTPSSMTYGTTEVIATYSRLNDGEEKKSVSIPVTVSKREATLSLSHSSITFPETVKSSVITANTNSTGAVTATSNNTNVATVSVSGKTITVNVVKPGSCTISVYTQQNDMYKQSTTRTCTIEVEKYTGTLSINKSSITFSDTTEEEIAVTTNNTTVRASTNNPNVAIVSVSGKTITVTVQKPGNCMLSVYGEADDVYTQTPTQTCSIIVEKIAGTISLNKSSISLTESDLIDSITVTTNSTGEVVAESTNTNVATVSVSGKTITVTGKKPGDCSITVYVEGDDVYTQTPMKVCSVSLPKFTGTLNLNKSSISLTQSSLTSTITATTNNTGTIVATSNSTTVATVSVSSKTITVTGKKPGTATISVYAQSDSVYNQTPVKTCTVTIAKFTGTISVSPTSVTLSPDNNLTAQVQVTTTNSAIYASTPSGWYTESVSGKTVTLIANKQGAGTASSLSIYGIADSVYNQTITKTVAVTVRCATLNVTAKAGATVFVEKGDTTLQAVAGSNGVASFKIWEYGTWSVYGVFNGMTSDTVTINVTTTTTYRTTLSFYKTYGVKIQKSNSNPETAVTYIDDAVGMTPKSGAWDDTPIFKGIRPCVLKDGVVQYYLNPNDMTKKVDGSAAIIDSISEGDVMIEIPKLGYQITNDSSYVYVRVTDEPNKTGYCYLAHSKDTEGDCSYIYIGRYLGSVFSTKLYSISGISPKDNTKLATFRTYVENKGNGYELFSFYPLTLLQCLYLIRYKDRNSQYALGSGYTNSSNKTNTGNTNTKGMYYGSTSNKEQIVFAGIEDFYGNLYQYIDGICSSSYALRTDYANYNDKGTGYRFIAQATLSSSMYGYISEVCGVNYTGFVPREASGSTSTYYTDAGIWYSNGVAHFGGHYTKYAEAGAFHLDLSSDLFPTNDGARIMFKKKA